MVMKIEYYKNKYIHLSLGNLNIEYSISNKTVFFPYGKMKTFDSKKDACDFLDTLNTKFTQFKGCPRNEMINLIKETV